MNKKQRKKLLKKLAAAEADSEIVAGPGDKRKRKSKEGRKA